MLGVEACTRLVCHYACRIIRVVRYAWAHSMIRGAYAAFENEERATLQRYLIEQIPNDKSLSTLLFETLDGKRAFAYDRDKRVELPDLDSLKGRRGSWYAVKLDSDPKKECVIEEKAISIIRGFGGSWVFQIDCETLIHRLRVIRPNEGYPATAKTHPGYSLTLLANKSIPPIAIKYDLKRCWVADQEATVRREDHLVRFDGAYLRDALAGLCVKLNAIARSKRQVWECLLSRDGQDNVEFNELEKKSSHPFANEDDGEFEVTIQVKKRSAGLGTFTLKRFFLDSGGIKQTLTFVSESESLKAEDVAELCRDWTFQVA